MASPGSSRTRLSNSATPMPGSPGWVAAMWRAQTASGASSVADASAMAAATTARSPSGSDRTRPTVPCRSPVASSAKTGWSARPSRWSSASVASTGRKPHRA